jgi:hypothetical protein
LSLVFKVLKVADFFSRQRRQQAKAIFTELNYRQQETTTVTGKETTGQGLGCKEYHTTLFIPSQSPIHTPVH